MGPLMGCREQAGRCNVGAATCRARRGKTSQTSGPAAVRAAPQPASGFRRAMELRQELCGLMNSPKRQRWGTDPCRREEGWGCLQLAHVMAP